MLAYRGERDWVATQRRLTDVVAGTLIFDLAQRIRLGRLAARQNDGHSSPAHALTRCQNRPAASMGPTAICSGTTREPTMATQRRLTDVVAETIVLVPTIPISPHPLFVIRSRRRKGRLKTAAQALGAAHRRRARATGWLRVWCHALRHSAITAAIERGQQVGARARSDSRVLGASNPRDDAGVPR
jgi:hypothetical protein